MAPSRDSSRNPQAENSSRSVLALRWVFFILIYAVVNSYWLGTITTPTAAAAVDREQEALERTTRPPVSRKHGELSKREPVALLNRETIQRHLLAEAPWAESHGANHQYYLAAGLLYYSFAYAFQSKTIVVLGSGGGFVPRMLRQAQRDLELAGMEGNFQLILIDAHLASAGWGSTFYATNKETVMRQQFADIRYMFEKTDDAVEILKRENVTIDYLHVDADHSHAQSLLDFENYFALLADRGVVSFHDTCHDPDRKCRTGVPDTVQVVREKADEYGLQLLDAHYLYRGIAFCIRKDAPALEAPSTRRLNFCRTNAAAISKSSQGFTLNARKGKLSTLGDFYNCEQKFNMTALGMPCAAGSRRDKYGGCTKCVPGLKGADCHRFEFKRERGAMKALAGAVELAEHQRHAAAWLGEQGAQHILELGASRPFLSDKLWHAPKSIWSLDPGTDDPAWTEDSGNGRPLVRRLPIPYSEAILDEQSQFANVVPRDQVDALVCLQCELYLSANSVQVDLDALVHALPRVSTIVLDVEHTETTSWLDQDAVSLGDTAWSIESDIILVNRRARKMNPTDASSRRMVLLTKKRDE